jgi:alpha-galactosidase
MKRGVGPYGLTRRDLLRVAVSASLAPLVPRLAAEEPPPTATLDLAALKGARGRVVDAGGSSAASVRLTHEWDGPRCRARVKNAGRSAVAVAEVVLFDVAHALPPETKVYGEGFQMLSQTGGTIGQPADLGDYTDAKHYRMPQPADATVAYNLLEVTPPGGPHRVLAFSSSRRFVGRFEVRPASLRIVMDAEGRSLGPGEEWELEELVFLSGPDREALLAAVGDRIATHHPPLRTKAPPSGWCSWYCFGPQVTADDVRRNLDVIARETPALRYIQVDDGYQPAMGDWLETGTAFGGDVQGVLKEIRTRGFEPAIWVAPFVAEKDSHVFRDHPDWFVRDGAGGPLRSDVVTFGGWRRGPWYVLDGTHPEAQAHLESVFRTMRTDWGCTYFKLDANFWGAMHGGRFHDPRATRVEAYRRGMESVRRGAGDAFILGCNHPLWPSLGLVHGSRSSNDIKRTWVRVRGTARQNLLRNWQNGRLWWNDPDAVVLTGLPDEEVRFHATVIHASGGMLLSGDDLSKVDPATLELLRKLQPPTGVAARFADDALEVGTLERTDGLVVFLLNWSDAPKTLSFSLDRRRRVRELWSGKDLGARPAGPVSLTLPARAGRVFVCTTVS